MCLSDINILLISFSVYENTVIDEDLITGRKKSGTLWNHNWSTVNIRVLSGCDLDPENIHRYKR